MADSYDDVPVTDETTLAQAPQQAMGPTAPQPFGGIQLDANAARGVAEVLGAISVARSVGRDEVQVWSEVRRMTKRKRLAERGLYAYYRKKQLIEGPSVDLIEQVARAYGHIRAGWRELERNDKEAKVECYAWDMYTNTHATRQIVVPFRRDKRGAVGGVEVTEQRDRYELMANNAARRMRACIEQLLPADLVDEAVDGVKRTLENGDGLPFKDRVREMLLAFEEHYGVRQQDLEARLGHTIDALVPAQLVTLRSAFNAMKAGANPQEMFPRAAVARQEATGGDSTPSKEPTPKGLTEEEPPEDAPVSPASQPSEDDASEPAQSKGPADDPQDAPPSDTVTDGCGIDDGEQAKEAAEPPEEPEVAAEVLAEAQRLGLDLADPDLEAKVAAARKPKKKNATSKRAPAKNATQGSLV